MEDNCWITVAYTSDLTGELHSSVALTVICLQTCNYSLSEHCRESSGKSYLTLPVRDHGSKLCVDGLWELRVETGGEDALPVLLILFLRERREEVASAL